MKKLIYISLLLILFISSKENLYSQSGWFWQNPLPQGNSLYSIKLVDANTAYACGYTGTIIKTTNLGTSWNIIYTDSGFISTSLYFHNLYSGWVVTMKDLFGEIGYVSKIMKTTDEGANWITKYSVNGCSMLSIEFTGLDTGFVMARNNAWGLIYKTIDEGENWNQIFSISGKYPHSSFFINSLTGYICGTFGIMKTTNGGLNWITQLAGSGSTSININSIYFVNINTGFSVGKISTYPSTSQAIYKTTNAGTNWIRQTGNGNSELYDVNFLDGNTGYACGNILISTTNGGNNWANIPFANNFYCYSIDMKFSNGMAAGDFGIILNTTNNGINWINSFSSITDGWGINSMQFINRNTGYALSGNKVLKTTNGGNNWLYLTTPTTMTLYSLSVINTNTIYAAGGEPSHPSNIILKSTNDGLNWISQNSQIDNGIISIFFVDPFNGYCMSWNGIAKTTNGGNNWLSIGGLSGGVKSMYFINESTGFVLAYTAAYKTTNGGINWLSIPTDGESIFFLNANTGYTVGIGMTIRKTTDGGLSWFTQAHSPGTRRLSGVHFLNAKIGYAVGNFGAIAKTTNGGTNWYFQKSPTNNGLGPVCVVDTNICYIAGLNYTILKTTNGGVPIGIQFINQSLPNYFSLSQNYPNPFNPSTTIKFDIPKSSHVQIVVYDLLGRQMEQLLNEEKKPGSYEVSWDGSRFASGVYFYKIITDEFVETKKMVLIK